MSTTPAILAFAEPSDKNTDSSSMYRYLADAGFEENEIKNWGNIGSLSEAMKETENKEPAPPLGEEFMDFVKNLPSGTTPTPTIKKRCQRYIPI